MEPQTNDGGQLGYEAAERIVNLAEEYCASQRQYLSLANEPRIVELRIHGQELLRRKQDIQERLRRAAPPGNGRSNRRQAMFCWAMGILLSVAAFYFSLLSFAPYRLGWTGRLVCIGIALITPYAVHELFEHWKSEYLVKSVVTLVFLSAVTGGALLAGIRADLLARQVQDASPAVVINGDDASAVEAHDSFYDDTKQSLRLLMVLLALAIDLGAGVAIHRALELGKSSGENYEALSNQMTDVNTQLATTASEFTACTNAPALFESAFWREFYRAALTHTARKGLQKVLTLILGFLLIGASTIHAQEKQLNLVVALDLSASVASKGPDGTTDFEKNVVAIGGLLEQLPAGSHVTVIGITADSFGEPDILLSAQIDPDPGYFDERLSAAHSQLVLAWKRRTKTIFPSARRTDIIGALLLAAQLTKPLRDDTNVLVIYSDMRQDTPGLNLEHRGASDQSLKLKEKIPSPNLNGVKVYALGVDGANGGATAWENLKQFWGDYLRSAGADLCAYVVLRDPPSF